MAGARYVNAQATYDVLRDFTPVSLVETSPFVMVVHPGVPVTTVKEFISLARLRPGKMTYGTIGAGQIPYWSVALFNNMARIQAVEVSYKTGGAAAIDVVAGRIDYCFTAFATANAQKGKLRLLGVTGAARLPVLPDVPTIAEAGLPGYEMPAWRSIVGPAGVHGDVVASLDAAVRLIPPPRRCFGLIVFSTEPMLRLQYRQTKLSTDAARHNNAENQSTIAAEHDG